MGRVYDNDPFDQVAAKREFKRALPSRTAAEAKRWSAAPKCRVTWVCWLISVVRWLAVLTLRVIVLILSATAWACGWLATKADALAGRMQGAKTMRSGDEPF